MKQVMSGLDYLWNCLDSALKTLEGMVQENKMEKGEADHIMDPIWQASERLGAWVAEKSPTEVARPPAARKTGKGTPKVTQASVRAR